jgi:hypothetical protein
LADFLKIVGVIIFVLAGGAMVLAQVAGATALGLVAMLPALVGGAAVYGLGDIMANLREIRRAAERQAYAMEKLNGDKPAFPRLTD